MRIEVDIYSGRPDNPTLELTAAEAEKLRKLLKNLTRTQAAPPEPGLGYRGFVITGSEDALGGLGARLRVFGGYVISEDRQEVFKDTGDVEGLLRQVATRSGYGNVIP